MINRYNNRQIFKNDLDLYSNFFKERNVKFINSYETPNFIYPDSEQMARLDILTYVWSMGDRYYKLAYRFYGDSKDWWVIAKFNQKPTESHVKIGDIILIPKPLNLVINYLRG
jgi:hypothetical protein